MSHQHSKQKIPTLLELIFEINEETLAARKHHPLIKSLKRGTLVEDSLNDYIMKNPHGEFALRDRKAKLVDPIKKSGTLKKANS